MTSGDTASEGMTSGHMLAPATGNMRVPPGTPTVVIKDVHVRYRVFADKRASLKERLVAPWKPRRYREVHALKGVSFTVNAGEVVGIIGPNGSGKSTLMRVIAGLQPTSSGEVYARATPMLLGVGAVLNRQLSGRRNILLGGLALGMSKTEILAREQDIIEFSGIGEAIDLPMRTYSSGMGARLQFAISAAVEPEILIVDEALAVGDQAFKQKSNRRIRELRASAGTVFLVSHSVKSLMQTCTRVIWIEDGLVKADGDPRETIRAYRQPDRQEQRRRKRRKKRIRKERRQRRLRKALAEAEAAGVVLGAGTDAAQNAEGTGAPAAAPAEAIAPAEVAEAIAPADVAETLAPADVAVDGSGEDATAAGAADSAQPIRSAP